MKLEIEVSHWVRVVRGWWNEKLYDDGMGRMVRRFGFRLGGLFVCVSV